jgi:2'-5' RNA ligase
MARLRTFIAVQLDPGLRDRCVGLQDRLARTGTDVKWVEQENIHVSLLFLGEVADRDVHDICRAVGDCCASQDAFALTLAGVGCFPNPRRPRVVWVGVSDGAAELTGLHEALEPPLLDLGCYRREERQYTPHVTLGRVKSDPPTDKLATALARQTDWQGGTMEVREVHVLSSELTPKGPIYTVLSRAKLRRPPRESRSAGPQEE